MGFLVGLIIGSGLFLIFRVYLHPHPVHITHAIRTRIKTRVLPAVAAAITGGFMAWLITSSTPISACIAALSAVLPGAWTGARERRRSREIREAWPEALDDVVNSLRAGVSMSEALSLLAIRGPEIMRPAFTQYAAHARATGRLIPALEELQDELADPMADRIVEAMRTSHELGGRDLASMLATLASMVREDNRARAELLARQSWTVNGARLAAIAPWLMLALFATRPGTIVAYSTPMGVLVLLIGLLMTVGAYLLMIRLGRLPQDERIFGGAR